MKTSDYKLEVMFVEGGHRAFAELYDRYAPPLFGVINRICKDEELSSEALQDTFLKAWKNKSKYDASKSKLFTWLYAIARNAALDKVRSRSRCKEIPMHQNINERSSVPDFNGLDLPQHMSKLDSKYRFVIHRIYFEGYTQQELSKESGIPIGTIKSRLRIGLRELRKVYASLIILLTALTITI